MSMLSTKPFKIGRNDLCHCGSGKKYKFCCNRSDMDILAAKADMYSLNQQEESSEPMKNFIKILSQTYDDHKVIDISNNLCIDNYKTFQVKNFTKKIIMVAEINDKNKEVFTSRGANNDVIVMYRGSYRSLLIKDYLKYLDNIDLMIETRLAGKDDK